MTKKTVYTSTTRISNVTDRKLTSDLLNIVKRHKTNEKKPDRLISKLHAEATVEDSFNCLKVQFERLERSLQMFRLQNKKILDDNKAIFANVLKCKRENNGKMKDVFTCAFTMLHSLESGHDMWADGEVTESLVSIKTTTKQSQPPIAPTQQVAGFRRRSEIESPDRLPIGKDALNHKNSRKQ